MRYEVSNCSGCGRNLPLINRTRRLCQTCNANRLHPNGKKSKGINGKSQKQQEIDAELHRCYDEIAREREHICSGCGTTKYLSHSHLIPRSYRRDLVAVKENIQYHCMSYLNHVGCHSKWEREIPGVTELKDYVQNMLYVRETDSVYFQKLLDKDLKYLETESPTSVSSGATVLCLDA